MEQARKKIMTSQKNFKVRKTEVAKTQTNTVAVERSGLFGEKNVSQPAIWKWKKLVPSYLQLFGERKMWIPAICDKKCSSQLKPSI